MITIDTTQGAGYVTEPTSGSRDVSFSVGSNTDRVLILFTHEDSNMTIGTPSYNGVNFTSVTSVTGSNDRGIRVWRLVNPATGTNTLSFPKSGSGDSSFCYKVFSLYGVDQTSPILSNNTGYTASGTSVSANLTPSVVGSMILGMGGNWSNNGNAPTGSSGFAVNNVSNFSLNWQSASYTRTGNGNVLEVTTSQTVSITFGVAMELGIASLCLNPAPSAPANLKTFNTATSATTKTINTSTLATVKSVNTIE